MGSENGLGLKGIVLLFAALIIGVAGTMSEPGGRFDKLTQLIRKSSNGTTTKTSTTTDTKVPVMPTTTTSNSLYPELTAIASNFDTSANLVAAWNTGAIPPSSSPDVVGAFRFICSAGQLLADDPIVYPGQPGKSHLHQFFGNMTADANSTYASLRGAGGSSCEGYGSTALNRSAYWMPAMLDGKGNAVRPDYVMVYYKRLPLSDPRCSLANAGAQGDCIPLPNGLRYIAGYDMVTNTPKTGSAYFNCDGATATSGHYATLTEAAANCPTKQNADGSYNRIGAVIIMPDCWDGVNLDSANHRSHMAYQVIDPNTGQPHCPSTHPKLLPTFTMGVWWTVDANLGTWHLSSDEMHPELPAGSTFHADWFGAWDNNVEAMWMDNCINMKLNCSGGDLGNGKQIKNAWGLTWNASPRTVAVGAVAQTASVVSTAKPVVADDGDSISVYWGGNWTGIYAASRTDEDFHGYAVGGSGLVDMNNRWSQLSAVNPNVVIGFIGANDANNTLLYPTAQDYVNAIVAYADRAHGIGAKVVWATVIAQAQPTMSAAQITAFDTRRRAINTLLRSLVGTKIDALIPFDSDARFGTIAGAQNTAIYPDGLHPANGYDIMAGIAKPYIDAVVNKSAVPSVPAAAQ